MTDDTNEAPRPDPGFRIWVERDNQRTDVTDAVMDVYDIAVNGMDFGSGFLSTEEVGNLRVLGKAIGAAHFDYQHDKCLRCGHDVQLHCADHPDGRHVGSQWVRWTEEQKKALTKNRKCREAHTWPPCGCPDYVTPVQP